MANGILANLMMKKTEFTALLLDRCATDLWCGKMKMASSIADRDFLASIISALCKGCKSALHIKRLEANMDTTTLIFVIIGAFTVSRWFVRLVNYLDGGNKRV